MTPTLFSVSWSMMKVSTAGGRLPRPAAGRGEGGHRGRRGVAGSSTAAIAVEGLRKRYDGREVLRGLDLRAEAGTVVGLLGTNGAGKTTTVRILSTLTRADGGKASVAGFDVSSRAAEVRRRIGLTSQYAAVDENLTARENLVLFGRLFHLGRRAARDRAEQLLADFGLEEAADRPVRAFSGGMRRRLDLAGTLAGRPEVVFLDEPSTGLDPAARQALWAMVRRLAGEGTAILLTTQYLHEADELADRVTVLSGGQAVAEGTPEELKRKVGDERLEVVLASPADLARAVTAVRRSHIGEFTLDEHRGSISFRLDDGLAGVETIAAGLRQSDIPVADFAVRRPTLDDVFIALTG